MKLISICRAFLLLAPMSLSSQNGGFPEIPPSVLPDAQMASNDGLDPMASRLFRTTATRTQIDLSGFWDFVADPGGQPSRRSSRLGIRFAAAPHPSGRGDPQADGRQPKLAFYRLQELFRGLQEYTSSER